MRPELPIILRAYARDLGLAGPQYATMAATLREAADELENCAERDRSCCIIAADVLVIDSDSVPTFGRPCLNCED